MRELSSCSFRKEGREKGWAPGPEPNGSSTNDFYCSLCLLVTEHGMYARELAGSIPINGRPRELRLHANPVGRTMIQVDGVTVYDKWPIV